MKEFKDLVQGSALWHEFRSKHLGSSCSPIILGCNPWTSPQDRWLDLVGLGTPIEITKRMQDGIDNEPNARNFYQCKTGIQVDALVAEHDTIPYLSASFDGISLDRKHGVEFKCPGKKTHAKHMSGEISEMYIIQCHKQMLIAEVDTWDFCSWMSDDDAIIIEIPRQEALIKHMLREEDIFWDCVQNFISPLTLTRKYVVINE